VPQDVFFHEPRTRNPMKHAPEVTSTNNADASETTPLKNSIEEEPAKILGITKQALIVRLVTCIVSLAEGYDSAIFGAVANSLVKEFDLSPAQLGLLGAMVPLACFIGAPLAGATMNYTGRKTLLMVVCLVIAAGAVIQALAPTIIVFGLGRFIIGLGMGAGLTTVTVYVAEVSPAEVRGRLTSLEEIFINVGMSLAFGVAWMLLGPSGIDWRDAMLLGVVLPLVAAALIPWSWTPESPRYLLLCGQLEQARLTMRQLGIPDHEAEQTMKAWTVEQSTGNQSARTLTWQSTATIHSKALMLSIGVACGVMLSGIIALHNLIPYVLATRMPEEEALRWATTMSTIKFIILIPVCFYLLDHVGRRPLLCVSAFVFAAGAAFTAFALMYGLPGEVMGIGYGVALCSYSLGMGPGVWPFIAEVLPTVIRAQGTGAALMCGRAVAVAWMLAFPIMFAYEAAFPFAVMACTTALAFTFFMTMIPETTQKTLETIEDSFASDSCVKQP